MARAALNISRGLHVAVLAGLWLLLCAFSPFEAEDDDIAAGNKAYDDQEFADAAEHYLKAAERLGDEPEINYNQANVLVSQKKPAEAMELYLKALTGAEDKLKAKTYYNMGNALLEQGKLTEAIDSYKRSLRLVPGDRDAIFNLELALHILEEQKKKQQDQKQQDQQQQDQQQQDQQQQDQQQQDQQQQDQQQQDQQQQDQQQQDQQQQDQQQQDQQQQDQQQQQQAQQGGDQQQQQAAQAMPIEKSEAEKLLDKLREEEKSFQMHQFMMQQGEQGKMEQDW